VTITTKITAALKDLRYCLSYESAGGRTVYARRIDEWMFERLYVGRGTRRTDTRTVETLDASVECSIVPGRTAVKGLCINEFLPIATGERSGYTLIDSERRFDAWLSEFCNAAPVMANEVRRKHGEKLLADTAPIRQAATSYLSRIPQSVDLGLPTNSLRAQASPDQLAKLEKWMREPIILIPNGSVFYEIACLLILLNEQDVESAPKNFENCVINDRENRDLMLRIQILASRVANEVGWDWPIQSD
jgi:hypothetical protein